MRSLILAAVAAFALTSTASAAIDSYMTFKPDAQGHCHDAKGKFVSADHCKPKPKQCRDPKTGRFVKCH